MDVQLALSNAIKALFWVEGVAERRELLFPQERVGVVRLPKVAEDTFCFPVDVSTVIDRREKVRHHSLNDISSAVRQVVIANEAEMADRLLVVVNVSAKSVVELLLTLLSGRHNNLVFSA